LTALCDAYLYILNHLEDENKATKDKNVCFQFKLWLIYQQLQKKAQDLYERM